MRRSILTLLRRSGVCRVHGLPDVVLLGFFERRSVQEMDRIMGLSEAATPVTFSV